MTRPAAAVLVAIITLVSCSPNRRASPASASSPTSAATSSSPTASPRTSTRPPSTNASSPTTTIAPTTSTTNDAAYLPYRVHGWIPDENKRPGSDRWKIPKPSHPIVDLIEGYAGSTSARIGDVVDLHVSSAFSSTYHIEAYRMGYYGGQQGRLVWASDQLPVRQEPNPTVLVSTRTAEARWPVNTKITITGDWPPGTYLLKLVSDGGAQSYIPLTIRDDRSTADFVAIDAVATWAAYNDWGACSLYKCMFLSGSSRATEVSLDRPIFVRYNNGSADFLDHELPLITLAEQLGLDITYVTDVDLHEHPSLVLSHKSVLTLGHDEYYSTDMYDALQMARDHGINLAFFGANAMFRRIRFEPGFDGTPDRRIVNYRSLEDPAALRDPNDVTVSWREPPLNRPEARLIGIMYQCPAEGDMTVQDARSWIWAGTGVLDGDVLPALIGSEYDHLYNVKGLARNVEVWSNSFVKCRGRDSNANSSYYTAASGAGVFATGTIDWICALGGLCTKAPVPRIVRQVTINVLLLFASGPAGLTHRSTNNVAEVVKPPPTTTTAPSAVDTTTSVALSPPNTTGS